jgi:hypothetical protein
LQLNLQRKQGRIVGRWALVAACLHVTRSRTGRSITRWKRKAWSLRPQPRAEATCSLPCRIANEAAKAVVRHAERLYRSGGGQQRNTGLSTALSTHGHCDRGWPRGYDQRMAEASSRTAACEMADINSQEPRADSPKGMEQIGPSLGGKRGRTGGVCQQGAAPPKAMSTTLNICRMPLNIYK